MVPYFPNMNLSLFDRLGGTDALLLTVPRFYKHVCADARVAHFFAKLDMDRMIAKQISFMTLAFGGPSEYSGLDLRTAHAEMVRNQGLGDMEFDAIVELLARTLREVGIEDELVTEVIHVIESTRCDVLNKPLPGASE